jgi:ubiquinone/menaquinone biosynthesis C-methylase UbiE
MENQQGVWDAIAASKRSQENEYTLHRKHEQPVVQEFLKGKTGKLLDLGCGTGRNFIYSPLLSWYCIDFSEKMLKHASINAGAKNIEAEFFHAEAHDLDFNDNFFDNILCYSVLHCIEGDKREKTIKEIYRVLRSGGQALISVWSRNSPRLKNKNKECYVAWGVSKTEKKLRYTYIYEFGEIKELLEKTGFKILSSDENMNLDFIVEKP